MKKTIYILSAICLMAVISVSCDKDFLTKTPETKVTSGSFFHSPTELALWTNNFYVNQLSGADDYADATADDHMTTSLAGIQKGTITPNSANGWTSAEWKKLRNINYFFENCDRCEDAAARAQYEGVAHFFRAMFYFDKVKRFGDVPYYETTVGSGDDEMLYKARDPRGYVMLKVIQDLDKAIEQLPDTPNDIYHVNKLTALAYKSRVALFEGTFRKYHAGTEFVPQDEQTFDGVTISSKWFLEEAYKAAEQVLGRKKLYTGNTLGLASKDTDASYRELFLLEDANPDEVIFARRYNTALSIRHGLQFDYKNGRHSATRRFVNHYLMKDGTPIQNVAGWETMDYKTSFQNRDPRMAQTLHGPSYVALDGSAHEELAWDRTWSGYRIIKHISNADHENATTSSTDWPLIRYAEVLLNLAEAKAELGILTDADVKATIDPIRARVGMVAMSTVPTEVDPLMKEYYPNASGQQLAAILEIRRERTIELFSEGFRQADLLRWKEGKWLTPSATHGFQGIYVPVLGAYDLDGDGKDDVLFYDANGTKPSTSVAATNQIPIGTNFTLSEGTKGYLSYFSTEDYVWNEGRDYLYPIPLEQLQFSKTELTQNPGWSNATSGN